MYFELSDWSGYWQLNEKPPPSALGLVTTPQETGTMTVTVYHKPEGAPEVTKEILGTRDVFLLVTDGRPNRLPTPLYSCIEYIFNVLRL